MPFITTRGVASIHGYRSFNTIAGIEIPNIGDPFQGGYYAGLINPPDSTFMYAIVLSPKAQGQTRALQDVKSGGVSRWDGLTNTTIGAASPANVFALGLSINGFSDWYVPAIDELSIMYQNLKPTTTPNATGNAVGNPIGYNPNSLPRGTGYTTSFPAQTNKVLFRVGEAECLDSSTATWTSTMIDDTGQFMYFQQHDDGYTQAARAAANSLAVRAVRRYIISQ